jgi:hypothetical protein
VGRPWGDHGRRARLSTEARRLDRMSRSPGEARRPVASGEWSAPTHLSWVAGKPGSATYGGSPTTIESRTVTIGLDVHASSVRFAAVRDDELLDERTLP